MLSDNYMKGDNQMTKRIRKSITTCALALTMIATAVPVTANAASNTGKYTTVSISVNSSDKATVRGSNNTTASKYIDLYLKAGTSLGGARIIASSSGVTNKNSSRTAEGKRKNKKSYPHYYGVSVIYDGARNSCPTLQSKSITY